MSYLFCSDCHYPNRSCRCEEFSYAASDINERKEEPAVTKSESKFELVERLGLTIYPDDYVSCNELEDLLRNGYQSIVLKGEPEQIRLYPKPKDERVSKVEIADALEILATTKHKELLERILKHGIKE